MQDPVPGSRILQRSFYLLFTFEILLGVAHLLWPQYRWGQGRSSYFNFTNSLTLASWLACVQLAAVALLAFVGFHRDRRSKEETPPGGWIWLAGALIALTLSFTEITRIHHRLGLLGYPRMDPYEQLVYFPLFSGLLAFLGWFLLHRLQRVPEFYKYGVGWLIAWGLQLLLNLVAQIGLWPEGWDPGVSLATGLAHLFGCTLLLLALAGNVLWPSKKTEETDAIPQEDESFLQGSGRIWIYVGVAGMTFTIVFLQIMLLRMLTIFGDYLTAQSVISIALLGISAGGLIGSSVSQRWPLRAMTGASLFLPASILMAFGASVSLMDTPLAASILLMFPFASASTVITVALCRARSHLIYCIDLLGGALAALLIGRAFAYFREESSPSCWRAALSSLFQDAGREGGWEFSCLRAPLVFWSWVQ